MKARRFPSPNFITAMFVLTLVLLAGCQELPARSIVRLREADREYRSERFAEAERAATSVIRTDPENPDTAEAYYLRGLARVRTSRRSLAEADFHQALRLCGRRELDRLLSLQLAGMDFEDGRFEAAARLYRRAVLAMPSTDSVADETWYRYGLSLQRSGATAGAAKVFDRLMVAHPTSPYARAAAKQKSWTRGYFTVQCGAYSRPEPARSAGESLRRRGVDAVEVTVDKARDAAYVVSAGRYRDYESARRALRNVRRIQPDAFVFP